MPIRSRFATSGDATAQHLMPAPICELFDRTVHIGTIANRKPFIKNDLQRCDERRRLHGDLWYWIRPAFTAYLHSPDKHIIVIGHILLADPDDEKPSTEARSIRLFVDDPSYRAQMYKTLVRRIRRDEAKIELYRRW